MVDFDLTTYDLGGVRDHLASLAKIQTCEQALASSKADLAFLDAEMNTLGEVRKPIEAAHLAEIEPLKERTNRDDLRHVLDRQAGLREAKKRLDRGFRSGDYPRTTEEEWLKSVTVDIDLFAAWLAPHEALKEMKTRQSHELHETGAALEKLGQRRRSCSQRIDSSKSGIVAEERVMRGRDPDWITEADASHLAAIGDLDFMKFELTPAAAERWTRTESTGREPVGSLPIMLGFARHEIDISCSCNDGLYCEIFSHSTLSLQVRVTWPEEMMHSWCHLRAQWNLNPGNANGYGASALSLEEKWDKAQRRVVPERHRDFRVHSMRPYRRLSIPPEDQKILLAQNQIRSSRSPRVDHLWTSRERKDHDRGGGDLRHGYPPNPRARRSANLPSEARRLACGD